MAKVVNLNRFRKDKARAEKRDQADANSVKFGQTKAEKRKVKTEAEKAMRHLDGHKRDEPDE